MEKCVYLFLKLIVYLFTHRDYKSTSVDDTQLFRNSQRYLHRWFYPITIPTSIFLVIDGQFVHTFECTGR